MDLIEVLRVTVLGNPIKSPDNITATSLFIDQLFYNFTFDLFIMIIIVTLGAIAIILVMRKRRGSRELLIYVTGAFIIFSALEYQYVSRILGSDATLHNVKVTKNIENALNRSKSYFFGVVGTFLGLDTVGSRLNVRHYLYQNKEAQTPKERRKSIPSTDRETKKQNSGDKKADTKTPGADANPARSNLSKNARKHPLVGDDITDKGRETAILKAGAGAKNAQDARLGTVLDTSGCLPGAQEGRNEGISRIKDSRQGRADLSTPADQQPDITLIAVPSDLKTMNGNDEDEYMKSILYIFENEFVLNNKIATYFEEMNSMKTSINSELNAFNDRFQAFYNTSMKMEREMSSFNASPKYFQYEANEMVNSAKEVLLLVKVLDNLNYRNGTDAKLNEIFRVNNSKPRRSFRRIESLKSQFWLNIIRCCAVLQAVAGIWLLVILFCEIDMIFLFVTVISVFLGLNIILSVYTMLLAQSIDKICILGNVDGCKGNFTTSFTRFAATANIDLNHKDRSLKVDGALNQIEQRTKNVIDILKLYLENSPASKFAYKSLVIQNFFDKITFVKEDFCKLTNNKTDEVAFYQNLDSMNQALYQIKNIFETIQNEKIVDFYTREVIFYNFIRTQRSKIVQHVYDQITQSASKLDSDQQTSCNAKKIRVCNIRIMMDKLFLFLLIGSTILVVLYIF